MSSHTPGVFKTTDVTCCSWEYYTLEIKPTSPVYSLNSFTFWRVYDWHTLLQVLSLFLLTPVALCLNMNFSFFTRPRLAHHLGTTCTIDPVFLTDNLLFPCLFNILFYSKYPYFLWLLSTLTGLIPIVEKSTCWCRPTVLNTSELG